MIICEYVNKYPFLNGYYLTGDYLGISFGEGALNIIKIIMDDEWIKLKTICQWWEIKMWSFSTLCWINYKQL